MICSVSVLQWTLLLNLTPFLLAISKPGRALKMTSTSTTKFNSLPVLISSSSNGRELQPIVRDIIRLPVWPVYGGVFAQIFDWLGFPKLSSSVLSNIGGRVVPMQLGSDSLSPFLLLVHHTHSFTPFDPMRPVTNLLLPEGFPAHPHSGFGTLTITLKGGLRHRDSEGIQMKYGDGDAQWMSAGRGVIHEEMWDVPSDRYIDNISTYEF